MKPSPARLGSSAACWLLIAAFFSACRPVTVRPVTTLAERTKVAGALFSDALSGTAENALEHAGGAYATALFDPLAAFAQADLQTCIHDQPALAAALAEAAILNARQANGDAAQRLFYLQAAATAWDGLDARLGQADAGIADPLAHRLIELYNRAVGRWLDLLDGPESVTVGHHPLADGTLAFDIARMPGAWPSTYFDRLETAEGLEIEGVRQRYLRAGFGAAMIGVRTRAGRLLSKPSARGAAREEARARRDDQADHSPSRQEPPAQTESGERFLPPQGVAYPVTAIIAFGAPQPGRARQATLHLLDPAHHERFFVAEQPLALAADFTAPYAVALSQRRLDLIGYAGALRPQRFEAASGIFMLEPYDPNKIPVLMVHGLLSSPLAFAEITNGIWGDQHLRAGFQVWHYMYPTGLPFLWAANDLRSQLAELKATVDPQGEDEAWRDMVVIAHSMGGLVTRTLAAASGDHMWDAVFRVRPDELNIAADRRASLARIFYFERLPNLRRVIFLATPHRGVDSAGSILGKAVSFLIKLPREMRDLMREVISQDADVVEPSMRKVLKKGGPSSIRALRSSDPTILALAEMPPHPSIAVHSILGDRGRGDGPAGSDGYVPYSSAHLDDVASELIVPTGHAVYEHRQALAEIRRILHLHLEPTESAVVHETP